MPFNILFFSLNSKNLFHFMLAMLLKIEVLPTLELCFGYIGNYHYSDETHFKLLKHKLKKYYMFHSNFKYFNLLISYIYKHDNSFCLHNKVFKKKKVHYFF
jgi:hypothetical protein